MRIKARKVCMELGFVKGGPSTQRGCDQDAPRARTPSRSAYLASVPRSSSTVCKQWRIRGSWSIGRRLEEGGQASGELALHRGGVRSHLRRWPLGAAVVLASSHVQSPGAYLHEIPLHFPTFRRLLSCSATKAFVVVFLSVNLYNLTSYILSGRECMGGSFSTHNSIIEY